MMGFHCGAFAILILKSNDGDLILGKKSVSCVLDYTRHLWSEENSDILESTAFETMRLLILTAIKSVSTINLMNFNFIHFKIKLLFKFVKIILII